MPRGVYKRKKKSKAERREIAKRAAATRAANRAAQETATEPAKPKRAQTRSKRFLSDDEKGKVVGYFFGKPGRSYASWDAVAADIEAELGIALSGKQAERLREAFSLPFDVIGQTEGDAMCEKRLERIEGMLAEIKASIQVWES